jgi:hypothetical protein
MDPLDAAAIDALRRQVDDLVTISWALVALLRPAPADPVDPVVDEAVSARVAGQ